MNVCQKETILNESLLLLCLQQALHDLLLVQHRLQAIHAAVLVLNSIALLAAAGCQASLTLDIGFSYKRQSASSPCNQPGHRWKP